ncbi:hypothetical protein ACOSQ3_024845 [Xanthoceras sorbifolium]
MAKGHSLVGEQHLLLLVLAGPDNLSRGLSHFLMGEKMVIPLNKDENIDTAVKERDAAIKERDATTKENYALRERVTALEAENAALSIETIEAISSLSARLDEFDKARDKYEKSSPFDAFMYQEFDNGMKESQSFLKDTMDQNIGMRLCRRWLAYYRMKKLSILDMHVEIPPKDGAPIYFVTGKRETLIIGASPDEGPIHGHDYSSFTSVGKKEIILCDDNDDNDLADEDAVSISLLMKKGNPSIGKNVDESSS